MAKNKLSDLNDHLFAQVERLNDETITPDQMELELKKAKAISEISAQIIKNAALVFNVAKSVSQGDLKSPPAQLGIENK